MNSYWAMSGYAAYVWPSVGLTLALLAANVWWARQLSREAKAEARRRIASQDAS
jgi:heme exporter protein CcmD